MTSVANYQSTQYNSECAARLGDTAVYSVTMNPKGGVTSVSQVVLMPEKQHAAGF